MAKTKTPPTDPASEAYHAGCSTLYEHPIFASLLRYARVERRNTNDGKNNGVPRDGWAIVSNDGTIRVHPTRRASPGEWVYVLAHCLLHLAWGHIRSDASPAWNAACDCVVARFLQDIGLGHAPNDMLPYGSTLPAFPGRDELSITRAFESDGIPSWACALGTANGALDWQWTEVQHNTWYSPPNWGQLFSAGLSAALTRAVRVASGDKNPERPFTLAEQARSWFITSYPLLGALAATFEIIEDARLCGQMGISVAAINIEDRRIHINPNASLNEQATRFVMAHELLHAGLRHDIRRGTRDPYLWNVACDFVINDWLLEMAIGEPPALGMLHDVGFRGWGAEAIYDHITQNLRRFRRLATMRGCAQSDILNDDERFWAAGEGLGLDEWLRGALAQGLELHNMQGRGFLPAGLVEEIRALQMPVVPWDVELAHWFDAHFVPIEKRRSYARASRRQSSTPDIARPTLIIPEEMKRSRTFGVVLDTSGSMERKILGKALGTIASYSIAHEVAAVRVIFCDATAYDVGFMAPEQLAGSVQVRGRGGTILQPGVDLLQSAPDFPEAAPILILTDALCEDDLVVRREHAFVIPWGAKLPFKPRGPVFEVK
ncbi:peptidase [bacterium]|nr:MAG: peptidase [bacterium]